MDLSRRRPAPDRTARALAARVSKIPPGVCGSLRSPPHGPSGRVQQDRNGNEVLSEPDTDDENEENGEADDDIDQDPLESEGENDDGDEFEDDNEE